MSSEAVTERYVCKQFNTISNLLSYIREVGHTDCLVLQAGPDLQSFFDWLRQQALFFPTVIVDFAAEPSEPNKLFYHAAVIRLSDQQIPQIGLTIDQAISSFILLKPDGQLSPTLTEPESSLANRLMSQQLRLATKLKERLDYLGVYYKRNPQNFLRHMTPPQKDELLRQLRLEYREIILAYFSNGPSLNDKIDNFVNVAFFADLPISSVVELHMDLMDEFSKQLKLEGRNDEILLDYRLALIDVLAHLCEMYRRSIPRES